MSIFRNPRSLMPQRNGGWSWWRGSQPLYPALVHLGVSND